MRISDWSSDVCSSDLRRCWASIMMRSSRRSVSHPKRVESVRRRQRSPTMIFSQRHDEIVEIVIDNPPVNAIGSFQRLSLSAGLALDPEVKIGLLPGAGGTQRQIGRVSCGARVCQYV